MPLVSTLTVQAGSFFSSFFESPAAYVSATAVTCLTPSVPSPGLLAVAVVNAPPDRPHASYANVEFEFKERSLHLDGVASYADASAVLAGAPGAIDAYTFAVWVKPAGGQSAPGTVWAAEGDKGALLTDTGKPKYQTLVGVGKNRRKTGSVFLTRVGNLAMLMYGDDGFFYYDDNILDAGGAVAPPDAAGVWHFVAVTMTAAGRGKLYVDAQPAVTFATTSRPAPDGSLTLGMDMGLDGSPTDFFAGLVDEFRVFSVSLTSAQLDSVRFSEGLGLAPASALVAYFQFNDEAETVPELKGGAGFALTAAPWHQASSSSTYLSRIDFGVVFASHPHQRKGNAGLCLCHTLTSGRAMR
eukprot:1182208-Prorocentrum_minimum.AAC.1